MAFKKAPRIEDDLDFVPKPTTLPVAPISASVAQHARGTTVSDRDRRHAEAMKRARAVKEDLSPVVEAGEIRGAVKIEILFGPKRTLNGPNLVKLQFWQSGHAFHGGGDELMYLCRDKKGEFGCGAVFSGDCVRGVIATCPSCKKAIVADRLARSLKGVFRTKTLANELARFWRKLNGSADIYLKFDPSDVKSVAAPEALVGGSRKRPKRGKALYPLRNILRDTAAGAALEERIFAFLTN